jgi:Tfp pilus assembly protein PilZ
VNKLRAYVFIDRLQPQLAAAFAAGATGFLPIGGQAALMVEVQPGIIINQAIDLALKAARVRPGKSFTERHFGFLEIHSNAQEEVRHAGGAILKGLGFQASDKTRPKILSSQIINKVSPYHAQMMNVYRNANLLLPGTDLFTIECEPAAYIALAANEVEKNVPITLVDCNEVGAVGRMTVSGTASQIKRAAETARAVLEGI